MAVRPMRFSWNACPVHDVVYPAGSDRDTSSTAVIACPELKPGALLPMTFAARKPLKRSSWSGPVVLLTEISALTGIMSPAAERT